MANKQPEQIRPPVYGSTTTRLEAKEPGARF